MAQQHGDPLVYNALTGKWQNASADGPSGAALPLVIGDPAGSQVSLLPTTGQTINVDAGTFSGTITTASSYASGASTESSPAYSAAVVFNEGLVNEIVGMLHMSGVGSGTAHAILMMSQSADATIEPTTKIGSIVPDPSIADQWNFVSAHQLLSHNQQVLLSQGWALHAMDPVAGRTAAAGWVKFTDRGYQNGFSDGAGPPGDWVPQFRFSPVGRTITWRGVIKTPGSGNPNGPVAVTLDQAYTIDGAASAGGAGLRWPVTQLNGTAGGWAFYGSTGTLSFKGLSTAFNQSVDISGHCFLT